MLYLNLHYYPQLVTDAGRVRALLRFTITTRTGKNCRVDQLQWLDDDQAHNGGVNMDNVAARPSALSPSCKPPPPPAILKPIVQMHLPRQAAGKTSTRWRPSWRLPMYVTVLYVCSTLDFGISIPRRPAVMDLSRAAKISTIADCCKITIRVPSHYQSLFTLIAVRSVPRPTVCLQLGGRR